jgi:hypothetical protein
MIAFIGGKNDITVFQIGQLRAFFLNEYWYPLHDLYRRPKEHLE